MDEGVDDEGKCRLSESESESVYTYSKCWNNAQCCMLYDTWAHTRYKYIRNSVRCKQWSVLKGKRLVCIWSIVSYNIYRLVSFIYPRSIVLNVVNPHTSYSLSLSLGGYGVYVLSCYIDNHWTTRSTNIADIICTIQLDNTI